MSRRRVFLAIVILVSFVFSILPVLADSHLPANNHPPGTQAIIKQGSWIYEYPHQTAPFIAASDYEPVQVANLRREDYDPITGNMVIFVSLIPHGWVAVLPEVRLRGWRGIHYVREEDLVWLIDEEELVLNLRHPK